MSPVPALSPSAASSRVRAVSMWLRAATPLRVRGARVAPGGAHDLGHQGEHLVGDTGRGGIVEVDWLHLYRRRLPPLPVVPQAVPVLRLRGRGRHARRTTLPRGDPAPSWTRARGRFAGRAGLDLPRRRHAVAVATRAASRARSPRSARGSRARAARDHARGQSRPTATTRTSRRGAPPGVNRLSIGVQSTRRTTSSSCSAAITGSATGRPRSRARSPTAASRSSRDFILGTPTDEPRAASPDASSDADHLVGVRADDRGPHRVRRARARPAGSCRARRGRARPSCTSRRTTRSTATRLRALRDSARTRGPASAPSTTRCTGAARRSSGSGVGAASLAVAPRRQRRARDQPAPASPTTSRRRAARGRRDRRRPRWPPTARGSAMRTSDGVAEAELPARGRRPGWSPRASPSGGPAGSARPCAAF